MKRFCTAVAAAALLALTSVAFGATAFTPGAQLTENSATSWRTTDIINNYLTGTAPGAADSSAMIALFGAKELSLVLWAVAPDSTSSVAFQRLYIQTRFGFGTANDSTGAFPKLDDRVDVAGDSAGVSYVTAVPPGTTRNWILYPMPGERYVDIPGYLTAPQKYFFVDLPKPPVGATYVSIRFRVGWLLIGSNTRGATTNAIDTKWKLEYRADLQRGSTR